MGLLDSAIGSLTGGNAGGGSNSPIGGMLSSLLGDGGQGGSSSMIGGLGGLVSKFEQAGLGGVVQSWVGKGPNQPVSPEQLSNVFGSDQVQGMASKVGMQPHDLLSQLSQHLPKAVDGMTPNGRLPDDSRT